MAPGFWSKIKNFFGKVWDGAKKVVKKVAPIAKTALPFLAPLIPGGAVIAPAISTGLGIAEKFADGDVGGGIKDIGTNITKYRSTAGGPQGQMQNLLRKRKPNDNWSKLQQQIKGTQFDRSNIDSPRIKLKL